MAKKNPQDATVEKYIAPLRRDLEKLRVRVRKLELKKAK